MRLNPNGGVPIGRARPPDFALGTVSPAAQNPGSERGVTPATGNQMITPAKTCDGKPTIYGWFVGGPVSTYRGLREVSHGDGPGIRKRALYDTGEKVRCRRPKQWREQ